ncbi:MAG: hypothetical protein EXS05_11305, partial [Planctomycetaceae bacterium]|nr:hypothetical protein [Planctomycetaceae bacterium]
MSVPKKNNGFAARHRSKIIVLSLSAVLLLAFVAFRTFRRAELPDIPVPFDVAHFGHVPITPADNAAEFYREAYAVFDPRSAAASQQLTMEVLLQGWKAVPPELRAWLEQNRATLDLFHQGSEQPDALDCQPSEMKLTTPPTMAHDLRELIRLAHLEALRVEDAGDLAGAWGWYRAVLRACRHAGMHGGAIERLVGIAIYGWIMEPIVRWAASPAVDATLLRAALVDVKAINKLTVLPSGPLKIQRPAFGLRMLFSESTGRDKLRASLGGHKEVNRCLIVGRKERSLCGCNWT